MTQEVRDILYGKPEVLPLGSGEERLRSWLNRSVKVVITDGRVLVGLFLCTDREANVIIGSCQEFVSEESLEDKHSIDKSRMLGLAMVPGRHIVSMWVDEPNKG